MWQIVYMNEVWINGCLFIVMAPKCNMQFAPMAIAFSSPPIAIEWNIAIYSVAIDGSIMGCGDVLARCDYTCEAGCHFFFSSTCSMQQDFHLFPPAARSHLSHRCFFALSATCLHVERMCSLFVWRVACSRQWDKWYAQEAFDKLHVMVYSIGFFQVLLFIGRYRVWEKKNISLTA